MFDSNKEFSRSVAARLQWVASSFILLAALAVAGATALGAAGVLPVLAMPLQFGDTVYAQAGLAIQGGLAVILLLLATYIPSGMRVLSLERSHRDFGISMSDVAEAYRICHAADRGDSFTLSEQFDAVKERILYLRRHPDLGGLEPAILESAAEMSYASRELADTYSDENISRARGFLAHRQEEAVLFEDRIERARKVCLDLRRQREAVRKDEAVMESRLTQLEDEFGELLTELGFTRSRENVIALPPNPKPVAAE